MAYGNITQKTLLLRMKHHISQAVIDEHLVEDHYYIDTLFERYARHLVMELSRYVAAQRLDMIDVPADWWSSVKLALFGEYWEVLTFLKPPEMVRFTLDANYPDYPIDHNLVGKPVLEIQTTAYSPGDWNALAD